MFVIALTKDEKVHIIESYKYPIRRWHWELPTGGIDSDRTPLQAAKLELAEEVGLTAKSWTSIGTFSPSSSGFMRDEQHVFVAQDLFAGKSHREASEAIRQVKTVSMPELVDLIKDGIFADGQSLAALMKFFAWRQLV